jgi:microbial collagenase
MKKLSLSLIALLSLSACQSTQEHSEIEPVAATEKVLTVEQVLTQVHNCNASITIRSQALKTEQVEKACKELVAQENEFHQVFNTRGKPVADDYNHNLRANFYHTRDEYVKYATAHFTMPTNNGGMYLEGYPDKKGNHAEFVAYEKNGGLWNLEHEFVHYLDGRFNKYGDYCNGLHDDHAGPEFCPEPNLAYPHGVWWGEGIAEYLSKGKDNPHALKMAADKTYALSELFNTSYNKNGGTDRVYYWGYLAVRFLMESHRDKVDEMLALTRKGDWAGYQSLLKGWSTSMDQQWFDWLASIAIDEDKD